MCSNVACRALTVGPANSSDTAIVIGEAAHIYGAKVGSARYRTDMTDVSRGEITNGIWLCRNCHKLVDSDPQRYPATLLFRWREVHERYVTSRLGARDDAIRRDLENRRLDQFQGDSELVRRIVRDQPDGWEYRVTAELLREYLAPTMRGWRDLERGLYSKLPGTLPEEDSIDWFRARIKEIGRLVPALAALYTHELRRAWGKPGEDGDAVEIRHVCKLIQAAAQQLLQWEETVRFISGPDSYSRLFDCLRGVGGMQLKMLEAVPTYLDEVADWIDSNPTGSKAFRFELIFALPDGWSDRIDRELNRITRSKRWFW